MSVPAVETKPRTSRRVRDLLAVNFGNALEWYDWNIYTIFAPYFAVQFFNPDDSTSAFLATLAVFAVGFVARPIGGYLFGSFADRVGRRQALFVAMMLTALGSLIIAVTPTYENIGIFASAILVAARLLQGLAHGGEMGTSVTYLVERAPKGRRAFFGSTSWVSVVIGTILATLMGLLMNGLLSEEQMGSWGWRIAFGVGAALGLYALYLRRNLVETDAFKEQAEDVAAEGKTEVPGEPKHRAGLLSYGRGLFVIFGVSAGGSLMFYTWLIYLPTYSRVEFGQDATSSLTAGLIAQVAFLFLILGAGLLGDRIGRRPLVIAFGAVFVVLTWPVYHLVDGSFAALLAAMIISLAGLALLFGVNGAVWAEALPTHVRAAGVAGTLSLSTALFGGTAPYLNAWLTENGRGDWFIIYMIIIAGFTLVTGLVMRESKDYALTR
ncbi:MFS transporter [Corynebacterium sp. YIM 101645]|uniref:MFS transporter n=1 Tax=Corynebacterium lemuris TaxID=1859292 RepID=A0ABT2FWS2_9CORY|nr:MFS transporter [Corynebacterium lemuris]MCS5478938.1 MFS transporter [Corynebacterium lemuris]